MDIISFELQKNVEFDQKKEILSLILDVKHIEKPKIEEKCQQFTNEYKKFMLKLMTISDILLVLCKKNHTISEAAQEVLNLVVLQFLIEEKMLNCDEDSVIQNMRSFYVNSNDEEGFPKKYFFFICHMQEMHSR